MVRFTKPPLLGDSGCAAAKSAGKKILFCVFWLRLLTVQFPFINNIPSMPCPSKTAQKKKHSIARTQNFQSCYSSHAAVSDDNATMTTPKTSSCSDAEIPDEGFTGCNNNEVSEEIDASDKEEESSLVDLQDNVDNDNISNEEAGRYEEDDELSELEGEELEESLRKQMEGEMQAIDDTEEDPASDAPQAKPTAYRVLMRDIPADQWKVAESNWRLGYSGHAERTLWEHCQAAREAEELNSVLQAL